MECGCAPGSWSQVAAKLINSGGLYDQGNLLRGIATKLLEDREFQFVYLFSLLSNTIFKVNKMVQIFIYI